MTLQPGKYQVACTRGPEYLTLRHEIDVFYRSFVERLRTDDRYLVITDFDSYAATQARVSEQWRDAAGWWRMSVLNTAGMGWFSSDRAIREYAEEIWRVPVAGTAAPVLFTGRDRSARCGGR